MTQLLTQNNKMKKSSKESAYVIYNFTLPAIETCPAAGACKTGCYAAQGTYKFGNVARKHQANYELSQSWQFIPQMNAEIEVLKAKAQKRGKQMVVRIHDSGDFYSPAYLEKWLEVMQSHSDVLFYAYSKQVKILMAYQRFDRIPVNFILIFSYGGVFDSFINTERDRHAKVFASLEELH